MLSALTQGYRSEIYRTQFSRPGSSGWIGLRSDRLPTRIAEAGVGQEIRAAAGASHAQGSAAASAEPHSLAILMAAGRTVHQRFLHPPGLYTRENCLWESG